MDREKLPEKRAAYTKLLRESLERAVAVLSSLKEVERVSLVGSYACGRADLLTDLDLLVVMRTKRPFLERLRELYSLLALPVDLDLLCYTPEELDALKDRPFFKKLLQKEVVLYEKKPS
ncbi:MAG: nucleotidyltransferase domain-containing protein [Bacillota bacterium]